MHAFRISSFTCLFLTALLLTTPCAWADWKWPVEPTPQSSDELVQLHRTLVAERLAGVSGKRVQGVTWKSPRVEVELVDGVVYLEPPVEAGSPRAPAAFFVGEARVRFRPESVAAVADMQRWLDRKSLDATVSELLIFAPGRDLASELGVAEGVEEPPLADPEIYALSKKVLGRLGTTLLRLHLNRDDASAGASRVLFAPEEIRSWKRGSEHAWLLLAHDPSYLDDVRLEAAGHDALARSPRRKFFFSSLVRVDTDNRPGSIAVDGYEIALDVDSDGHGDQETVIHLRARHRTSAVRPWLTPYVRIKEVSASAGRTVRSFQWLQRMDPRAPDPDQNVLLSFDPPLEAGEPVEVRLAGPGKMFHWGRPKDRDGWHPWISGGGDAPFDLSVTVPRKVTVVAPGELVATEKASKRRTTYRYRNETPWSRTTLQFGAYQEGRAEGDGVSISVFAKQGEADLRLRADALLRCVNVFQLLLGPPAVDAIRVVDSTVHHGRHYPGFAPVGSYRRSQRQHARADASLRRPRARNLTSHDLTATNDHLAVAHELAHQWWGCRVRPRHSRADEWLYEGLAELAAMEFERAMKQDEVAVRETIARRWHHPFRQAVTRATDKLVDADHEQLGHHDGPLVHGGINVKTKAPAVLQQLRYLFALKTGNDDAFWGFLQDVLREHDGERLGTEDFQSLAGARLEMDLAWFFDQWVRGAGIPAIAWRHSVRQEDGRWMVDVEAEQRDTAFTLLVPVTVHFSGGRFVERPLQLTGASGQLELAVPEDPVRVSLNDSWKIPARIVKLD